MVANQKVSRGRNQSKKNETTAKATINGSEKKALKRPLSSTSTDQDSKKRRLSVIYDLEAQPSGVLLTLGQGDVGQLGLGDEILSRKKPAIVSELSDNPMTKIAAGGMHTICLTKENEVYSFGCNDEFALGRITNDENSEYEPGIVDGPLTKIKVVHITAGDSHTAALSNDGSVFVWGSFRDSHGKLGLIKQGEDCKCPTRLDSMKDAVVSIASGNDHIVMVSAVGTVFTFGCAEQGQLGRIARYFTDRGGRRSSNSFLRPCKVSIPRVNKSRSLIVQAFCGAYSTWVIAKDGSVFGFGLNNYNQLGFPDSENRYLPELVPALSGKSWKQLAAGQHHTLCLNQEGKVYALGRGDYGRLGLGEDIEQADTPTHIPSLTDIVSVAANGCVSFAIDKAGAGYGWGIGTNLQLTTGDEDDVWEPVKLTGRNLETRQVAQVGCGGQHTVIIATDRTEEK
uniref:Regulator of chromosome condensation n=1 Tax=Phallusia mammillata TaxID=59560 RepID=A0A6F9DR71_9ASCI|nr:regulator of chromosome condensation [Phallusia mammillata]